MAVIALVVGELTAYLTADNSDFNRGIAEAKRDLDSLGRDATRQSNDIETRSGRVVTSVSKAMSQATRNADKQGQEAGGKLSQGISQGIVRNSPLIVAAVGAALAAGAPVALAGATALFGSIGIIAQAQSIKVKTAWADAWTDIKAEAFSQSSAIQPVLVGLASQVSDTFRQMGPSLRDAFEAAAPQLQVFANGILSLATNTLPGLVRAVQAGMPVTQGLASLLESVGKGLSAFFDALSAHAPAAGEAFAAIGHIVEQLLPTLGELLGQGAELASIVLPPLASALGVVADVAHALGPLLPAIALGFAGMKAAQAAAGWVGSLGDRLKSLPSLMTATNIAAAGIGAAVMLAVSAYERATEKGQEWADQLREGGDAAAEARAKMTDFGTAFADVNSGWDGVWNALSGIGGQFTATALAMGETKKALDETWRAMAPLEQATSKVSEWTATLAQRLRDEGESSDGVAAAHRRLAYWQEIAARLAREEAEAIHGSAIAMEDAKTAADNLMDALDKMNNPALTLRDTQRGFQQALDDLTASIEENGHAMDIQTEAGRANQDALDNIASSAMDMANAYYESTGDYDGFVANLQSSRQTLLEQATLLYGSEEAARAYVETVLGIPSEWRTVAEFDTSTAQGEVAGIIDYLKSQEPNAVINVGVISEEAFNILDEMGIAVEAVPDGTVKITMDDAAFNATAAGAQNAVDNLDAQRPTPVLDANGQPLAATVTTGLDQLGFLGRQRPTPVALLNSIPLLSGVAGAIGRTTVLGQQRPTPVASLIDQASHGLTGIINLVQSIPPSRTTTITTVMRTVYETIGTIPLFGGVPRADGGPIFAASGVKITGPGGPRDDLVRAYTPGGPEYRVSPGEWIVNAFAAAQQGDRRMTALNAGRADIVMRDQARGLADGGRFGSGMAGDGGRTTHITVTANTADERRIARMIVEEQHDDEFLSVGIS